ncbi:hypothetical protein ACI2L1_42680 [Streptomyces sp. NPDC019531]|uniref:hypothetical protein n=1 Tax=Streptomyces sp. NPDC019531 TaxID=3365062 RepID=UPI00384C231C
MAIRTTLTGAAVAALAIAGPLTGVAHAQDDDLDCADFVYQEDAQAVFDLDRSDPNRLDEDQGPDDGIACEVLPRRSTAVVSTATATATATAAPTLGVQGGTGGSVGPAAFERAVGVALALGGLGLAGAYVVKRRRGTGGRAR